MLLCRWLLAEMFSFTLFVIFWFLFYSPTADIWLIFFHLFLDFFIGWFLYYDYITKRSYRAFRLDSVLFQKLIFYVNGFSRKCLFTHPFVLGSSIILLSAHILLIFLHLLVGAVCLNNYYIYYFLPSCPIAFWHAGWMLNHAKWCLQRNQFGLLNSW